MKAIRVRVAQCRGEWGLGKVYVNAVVKAGNTCK